MHLSTTLKYRKSSPLNTDSNIGRFVEVLSFSVEYETPNEHYLDEEKREGVRDWILAVSLDSQLTNALDTAPCVVCDVETFVGNEVCHNCQVIFLN